MLDSVCGGGCPRIILLSTTSLVLQSFISKHRRKATDNSPIISPETIQSQFNWYSWEIEVYVAWAKNHKVITVGRSISDLLEKEQTELISSVHSGMCKLDTSRNDEWRIASTTIICDWIQYYLPISKWFHWRFSEITLSSFARAS